MSSHGLATATVSSWVHLILSSNFYRKFRTLLQHLFSWHPLTTTQHLSLKNCTGFPFQYVLKSTFNPLTAPASKCNISELKSAHTLANSIFSGPRTNVISILCVLMKILSRANTKKKTKRLKVFNFRTFIACFQMTSWH